MKVKDYIEDNLLARGYETWVEVPSIEQLLMLKQLCEIEIAEYFKEECK